MIFGKMSKNKPAFEDDIFHSEGQYQQEDNRPTGLLLEQGFESRLQVVEVEKVFGGRGHVGSLLNLGQPVGLFLLDLSSLWKKK